MKKFLVTLHACVRACGGGFGLRMLILLHVSNQSLGVYSSGRSCRVVKVECIIKCALPNYWDSWSFIEEEGSQSCYSNYYQHNSYCNTSVAMRVIFHTRYCKAKWIISNTEKLEYMKLITQNDFIASGGPFFTYKFV